MPKPVPPSGPTDAELVIVGRDPGFEESQRGVPFVGAAGRLLDRVLSKAMLPREKVLITNVVDTQPPGNKWEAHDPADVERGVRSLRALLRRHPRQLIVAMGNEALTAVMGGDPRHETFQPITEARGYVFHQPLDGWRVLACTHPAFVIRNWHPWWALLQWDMEKAKRALVSSRVPSGLYGQGYTLLSGDADRLVEQVASASVVALDIETAQSGEPVCLGVSVDRSRGVTLPLPAFRKHADAILEARALKVFHNAQFDLTMLDRAGYCVAGPWSDTMLLWHTAEPMLAGKSENGRSEKSLRFLASLLLDEEWWKDYDFRSEEERWLLCARDARITLAVYEILIERVRL